MSDVLGFADIHNHQFSDLAFGGRVVFGSAAGRLSDLSCCGADHGPHGLVDLPGNVAKMSFDHAGPRALLGHRTRGWPTFEDWPRWNDYTHQGVHREWLRRAVDGGLRLMVMLAVHNTYLCRATRAPWKPVCDTVAAVRSQLDAARRLQREIDSEQGAGRGWYRIVDDPDQAAEVIASGRLAVVLGAEVDDLFSLGARPDIDDREIDAIVDRCVALGLHHLVPLHFSDNGVGGSAFQVLSWARDQSAFSTANPRGSLPLYRVDTSDGAELGYTYRAGRVNRLGLTPVGRRLMERLLRRGLIIDIEHMGVRARSDTLDLAEGLGKPLASGHVSFRALTRPEDTMEGELTEEQHRRLVALGGMVAPITRQSLVDPLHLGGPGPPDTGRGLLAAYRHAVSEGDGRPVALGTDLNGFAGGTRPRFDGGAQMTEPAVTYPFATELGTVQMDRAVSGARVFDFNVDGLAHVGLLPDLIAELRTLGATSEELRPLMRSAQGYLDMWRACRS